MGTRHFTDEQALGIAGDLGIDWSAVLFDLEQFRMGMDVELEHGTRNAPTNVTNDDPLITGKIALAHLTKMPDYYTRLAAMEGGAETVVLYRSKYGSTQQYAEWIAASLGADIMPLDYAPDEALDLYKTVILGAPVRMGIIICADFLNEYWEQLKGKRIILFSVSGTEPGDPEICTYYEKSLPEHIRNAIRYFPLWGRAKHLDLKDRLLMLFPQISFRLRLWLDPGNPVLQKKFREITMSFDHVERRTVEPLLEYCRS